MRVSVLGSGLVGGAIVQDLARDHSWSVRAVDRSAERLAALARSEGIETACEDVASDAGLNAAIHDADLVVNALPGHVGYDSLRRVIEAGKNVVDISFFAEDPFELDGLARERGVTAVVDCGIAPGLSNVIAGHVVNQMDSVDSYLCLVGGLPAVRTWPYEYKAVFSPLDVIAEFTRPARFVEHGELIVRPALSDVEPVEIEGLGTLEAFNTDGLRSLLRTLDIPDMKEKTLRYPGHANLMRVFRDSGFFDTDCVDIGGEKIRPVDVTSRLLFEQWQMAEEETDLTVMLVVMTGRQRRKHERREFFLLDRFDPRTGTTSMARTTGYTCASLARLVLTGGYRRAGISPPEYLGWTPGCYEHLLAELGQRNIVVRESRTVMPGASVRHPGRALPLKIA